MRRTAADLLSCLASSSPQVGDAGSLRSESNRVVVSHGRSIWLISPEKRAAICCTEQVRGRLHALAEHLPADRERIGAGHRTARIDELLMPVGDFAQLLDPRSCLGIHVGPSMLVPGSSLKASPGLSEQSFGLLNQLNRVSDRLGHRYSVHHRNSIVGFVGSYGTLDMHEVQS
jgi:hypothetical protein